MKKILKFPKKIQSQTHVYPCNTSYWYLNGYGRSVWISWAEANKHDRKATWSQHNCADAKLHWHPYDIKNDRIESSTLKNRGGKLKIEMIYLNLGGEVQEFKNEARSEELEGGGGITSKKYLEPPSILWGWQFTIWRYFPEVMRHKILHRLRSNDPQNDLLFPLGHLLRWGVWQKHTILTLCPGPTYAGGPIGDVVKTQQAHLTGGQAGARRPNEEHCRSVTLGP